MLEKVTVFTSNPWAHISDGYTHLSRQCQSVFLRNSPSSPRYVSLLLSAQTLSPSHHYLQCTYSMKNSPAIEKIDANWKIFIFSPLSPQAFLFLCTYSVYSHLLWCRKYPCLWSINLSTSSLLNHSHQHINMLYRSAPKVSFLFLYSPSATIYFSASLHSLA